LFTHPPAHKDQPTRRPSTTESGIYDLPDPIPSHQPYKHPLHINTCHRFKKMLKRLNVKRQKKQIKRQWFYVYLDQIDKKMQLSFAKHVKSTIFLVKSVLKKLDLILADAEVKLAWFRVVPLYGETVLMMVEADKKSANNNVVAFHTDVLNDQNNISKAFFDEHIAD
jgi:hypothetical protein